MRLRVLEVLRAAQRVVHLLAVLPRARLMFGATEYAAGVDIWSVGTIPMELLPATCRTRARTRLSNTWSRS